MQESQQPTAAASMTSTPDDERAPLAGPQQLSNERWYAEDEASSQRRPTWSVVASWARILWPAIAFRSSFYALYFSLRQLAGDEEAVAAHVIFCLLAVVMVVVAYILLNRQFTGAWCYLIRGEIPPHGLTCSADAWYDPCCWRPGFGSVAQPPEEATSPPPALHSSQADELPTSATSATSQSEESLRIGIASVSTNSNSAINSHSTPERENSPVPNAHTQHS